MKIEGRRQCLSSYFPLVSQLSISVRYLSLSVISGFFVFFFTEYWSGHVNSHLFVVNYEPLPAITMWFSQYIHTYKLSYLTTKLFLVSKVLYFLQIKLQLSYTHGKWVDRNNTQQGCLLLCKVITSLPLCPSSS